MSYGRQDSDVNSKEISKLEKTVIGAEAKIKKSALGIAFIDNNIRATKPGIQSAFYQDLIGQETKLGFSYGNLSADYSNLGGNYSENSISGSKWSIGAKTKDWSLNFYREQVAMKNYQKDNKITRTGANLTHYFGKKK